MFLPYLYFSTSVIALYTAIQSIWLSRLGPNRHIYGAYAALCVAICAFLLSSTIFTMATSLEAAKLSVRLQSLSAFAYLAALSWLMLRYADIPVRGLALRFILLYCVVTGLLGLYSLTLDAGFFVARLWPMGPDGPIPYGFDYRPGSAVFQLIGLIGAAWCFFCVNVMRHHDPLAAKLFSSFLLLLVYSCISQLLHYFFGLQSVPVLPGGVTFIWLFVIMAILFARDHEETVAELVEKNQSLSQEMSSRTAAERQARMLALNDELTKLANIRNLKKQLEWYPTEYPDGQLLLIQIDYFRELKQTFGEAHSDQLLLQVAKRLQDKEAPDQLAARISESQFAVLTRELQRYIDNSAESLSPSDLLTRPFYLGPQKLDLTYSMALVPLREESNAQDALYHAELALEQAVSRGGNQIAPYNRQFAEEVRFRLTLERDLDRALPDRQLTMHYQPQVDSAGHLIGAEALLRWQHPEHGWISPATFIPLAERRGLIRPIGQWVLEQACRDLKSWQQRGSFIGRVSVNVSPLQLQTYRYAQSVLDTLRAFDVSPTSLSLELTESGIIEEANTALVDLPLLRKAGVTIAIDDFGTGFSSLSYLGRLPVDTLKIDKSFVDQVGTARGDDLLKVLLDIGRSLDMKVLAEGVEQDEQRQKLEAMGCHYFQGYLFSRPVPADQLPLTEPLLAVAQEPQR
ncbi:putative bifunctional diguanylate cyclase/phosphodiesterase [Litorivivens sp.]|uniref:putative bifunctional diguanylate cyclase/phosphodiesterase n=1 Tax=Litorivivens sp. TaxID=2020868 RepID=UPI003565F2FC